VLPRRRVLPRGPRAAASPGPRISVGPRAPDANLWQRAHRAVPTRDRGLSGARRGGREGSSMGLSDVVPVVHWLTILCGVLLSVAGVLGALTINPLDIFHGVRPPACKRRTLWLP
jgi:hypothetical protein